MKKLHANCIGTLRSRITYSGTLCDRSTTEIYGDNIADSDDKVTCKWCLKALAARGIAVPRRGGTRRTA